MATRIKFTGVPKTFTSSASALKFLSSSPGYVSRQGAYLNRYWPGLMADLDAKQTKTQALNRRRNSVAPTQKPSAAARKYSAERTIFVPPQFTVKPKAATAKKAPWLTAAKPADGMASTVEREKFQLGLSKKKQTPNVADLVPEPRRGGGQWSLNPLKKQADVLSGIGSAAVEGAKQLQQWQQDAYAEQINDPGGTKALSSGADFALGKSIPNALQGQLPEDRAAWLGLAGSLAAIGPVGKGGRALGAGIKAGLEAQDVAAAASKAYHGQGVISKGLGKAVGRSDDAAGAGAAGRADAAGVGGVRPRAGGTPEGDPGSVGAGAVDPRRLNVEAVPRTPEAIDARVTHLDTKLDNPLTILAKGLREIGIGKGSRPSLAPGAKFASSYGQREQMIIDEWKAVEEAARKGKKLPARRYGSWEEMAIEKYGAHTDARGQYLGFDADNINVRKSVETDQSPDWYKDAARAELRKIMVEDAAKGDRRAQAIVAALDERESLVRLRSNNAGADLFPDQPPVGGWGYGFDLRVSPKETVVPPARVVPAPAAPAVAAGSPPVPPRKPPTLVGSGGGLPPGEGPKTLHELVQDALQGAPEAIAAQNKSDSLERGIRAQAGREAYHAAGGGIEGRNAALGELKGAMPVIPWAGGKEFTPEVMDDMVREIWEESDLRFYEMIRASKGLDRILAGRAPQKNQLILLEHVFGKETADVLANAETRDLFSQLGEITGKIWNIPRTIMSSYDISGGFRQALVAGSRHPVIFAKNYKPLAQALGSERLSVEIMEKIPTRANFQRYGKAKLDIIDPFGGGQYEEAFVGSYVDNFVGIKQSARSYVVFLNRMRVDTFDRTIKLAERHNKLRVRLGMEPKNLDDPQFLEALGEYINTSTGRGRIPGGEAAEGAAKFLATYLFSPRLLASRFQILNPVYYVHLARKDPWIAYQQFRAATQTLAGIGTMVYLANNIPGTDVGTNPLSADFGKVRIGDTRIDFAGGFQPLIVLYSRLIAKESVSSSTGKSQDINGDFGTSTRPDVVYKFMQTKMSPSMRILWDRASEKTYTGEPVTTKGQLWSMAPMSLQGSVEAYQEEGSIPFALGVGALSSIGFGTNSYPDKAASDKKKSAPWAKTTKSTKATAPWLKP